MTSTPSLVRTDVPESTPANPPLETCVRTLEITSRSPVVFDRRVTGLGAAERPLAEDCRR